MSQPEPTVAKATLPMLADRLADSFRGTSRLLQQLHAALQQRRASWISARPSTLAEPAHGMEPLAQQLAAEEKTRAELVAAIEALLPPVPGFAASDVKTDVTRIAAALPHAAAARLRAAADAATSTAQAVRIELALGDRLLRHNAQAQEQLLQRIAGAGSPLASLPGYDRHARARSGVGLSSPSGTLIDGRL